MNISIMKFFIIYTSTCDTFLSNTWPPTERQNTKEENIINYDYITDPSEPVDGYKMTTIKPTT